MVGQQPLFKLDKISRDYLQGTKECSVTKGNVMLDCTLQAGSWSYYAQMDAPLCYVGAPILHIVCIHDPIGPEFPTILVPEDVPLRGARQISLLVVSLQNSRPYLNT